MNIEKPPVLNQIRDIIEREYATPPIVSGKCWEERATAGIAELLEPLIQQAKAEEREKVLAEIQAGAVSVADLIEKARIKAVREIIEDMEKILNFHRAHNKYFSLDISDRLWDTLKSKWLKEEK